MDAGGAGLLLSLNEVGSTVLKAARGAGIPRGHAALTVNKVCGSGLMAAVLAAQ